MNAAMSTTVNTAVNAASDAVAQGPQAACAPWDVACQAGSALESLVTLLATGAADMVVGATTWWLTTPSVDPRAGAVLAAQGALAPVVTAVLMTSVLVAAARLIISRRAEPLATLAAGLARFAVVSALGLLVLHGILVAGDALAADLLAGAAGQFGEFMRAQLIADPENVLVSLLLSLVAAVLAIIQWVLMELRQAGLLVLAAMVALAAALTKAMLYRYLGWLLAVALYKPVAAFIYFIGFTYVSSGNSQFAGLMVLVLAVVAMPALMRFFSWTGTQISGSGGGSGFLGAAGAVAMSQSYQQSHAVNRAQTMESTGPGSQPGDTTTTASTGAVPTGSTPTGTTTTGTATGTASAGGTASSAGGAGVAGGVAAVAGVAVQAAGRARDEMTSPPPGASPAGPDVSSGDSGRTAAGSVRAQPPPRDGGRT